MLSLVSCESFCMELPILKDLEKTAYGIENCKHRIRIKQVGGFTEFVAFEEDGSYCVINPCKCDLDVTLKYCILKFEGKESDTCHKLTVQFLNSKKPSCCDDGIVRVYKKIEHDKSFFVNYLNEYSRGYYIHDPRCQKKNVLGIIISPTAPSLYDYDPCKKK